MKKQTSLSKGELFKNFGRVAGWTLPCCIFTALLIGAVHLAITPRNATAKPRPDLRADPVLIAAPPASATVKPGPDPGCFSHCQANLAGCLADANGDPIAEFQCQTTYNQCGDLCMM
jgi:hypothetical protein